MMRSSVVVSFDAIKIVELEEQLKTLQEDSKTIVEKFSGNLWNEFKQSAKENKDAILGELRSLLVHLVGDKGKGT